MRVNPLIPVVAILSLTFLSACRSSPISPSSTPAITSAPAMGAASTASGRMIDALTGAPLSAITLSLDGDGVVTTSGADGAFQVTAPEAGLCSVTASGAAVVERKTELRMPGAGASLSLIPSQFDLRTFDELCRNDGALHRWVTSPSLVIVDAVLLYTSVSDSTFTALDERLTEQDRAAIAEDLEWGLRQVTGGAFAAFASVKVESPLPGAPVGFFTREGSIVVARFRGLSQGTGYWGYGRSARRNDAVVAGAIMIDRDFDVSQSPSTRSLRIHELGHALGYGHVTGRQSFMNSAAVVEPTDFDRDATRVAFQRPPGNQSPDRDPPGSGAAPSSARMVWGAVTR